jgi:hypothetical protein
VGSVALNGSGVASLTISNWSPGSYPITATYEGSATDTSSLAALNQVVNPYATTMALMMVRMKVGRKRTQYVIEAMMTASSAVGLAAPPTGTVAFTRNGALMGSVALQGGIAMLPIGATKPRKKSFTATFPGGPIYTQASARGTF